MKLYFILDESTKVQSCTTTVNDLVEEIEDGSFHVSNNSTRFIAYLTKREAIEAAIDDRNDEIDELHTEIRRTEEERDFLERMLK